MRRQFGFALAILWMGGAAQADIAAITSQNADKLTLIDTARLTVLAEVDLPGRPAAVTVDPVAGRIYAVTVEGKRLEVFDREGRHQGGKSLGGAPFGVAYDGGQDLILITDAAEGGLLRRFRARDLEELAPLPQAANPCGIAVSAQGHYAVAARDADLLLVTQGEATARIAVGLHPFGVTIEEGRAFVTNVLGDDLSVIDLAQGREQRRVKTGSRPYAVAFSQGRGFVTNQYDASVTVFDARDLRHLAQIAVGEYPEGIAATSEGRLVVANWFSDSVSVIDARSLEVLAEIDVAEGPRAFGSFILP